MVANFIKTFFLIAALLVVVAAPSQASDDILTSQVNILAKADFQTLAKQIDILAATGDSRIVPVLKALENGTLYYTKSGDQVVLTEKQPGRKFALTAPLSGENLGIVKKSNIRKIKVNNKLRRIIAAALGGMTLMSKDPVQRQRAADNIFKTGDAAALPALDKAIESEAVASIRKTLIQSRASALLNSDASDGDKIAAVAILVERGDRDALSVVSRLANGASGELKAKAQAAVTKIQETLELWGAAQNIWYGLSLGSVLLLAAIGLAITFGVMGVINMAHGEMVMLGAYTTFVVQEVIRTKFPYLFDYSLLIAVPAAFMVAGGVGVAVERGIIRFLYGRPLETLLATWGLSLVLQQTVRTIFGPSNREVGAPDFMSGAFQLGQLTITYNRMWIIVFSLMVLFTLMLVLKKTPLGLQMRAVTQNRPMAAAMGIRTNWVDAATFGLGSGIAGIAGVALSQIDNVSPNLGQSYIIDSFMVVVFGGVGNLWGTLVGAMTLGIANKYLEPYAGAVLGKVLVLVFIILFIQKRPMGLFALKGRAVET